jgi:membrane protein DedA with SNARE-associated domain
VTHGERLFKRREVWAIVLTPPWVAGINRSRARVYLPINAMTALVLWAAPLAIGAYLIGPPILDFFGDIGVILTTGLVVVIAAVVAAEVIRRRRRASRPAETSLSE